MCSIRNLHCDFNDDYKLLVDKKANKIDSFSGEYHFLSNFYPCEVCYQGLTYLNVEAAFQSAKTMNMEIRKEFCQMPPNIAKRKGRNLILRRDWETVKDEVMYQCVLDKFSRNTNLKKKLLSTGDAELIEGNTWNDRYWGVCKGVGKNTLGKILMKVREELKVTE